MFLLFLLACSPIGILLPPDSDPPVADSGENSHTDDTAPAEHLGAATGQIFSDTEIHPFSLLLDADSVNNLNHNPTAYTEATLQYGALSMLVGVRIKGTSSFETLSGKPSLKVDVNRYADQEFMGVKKFNLHNMRYDPSKMSEELAYGMFRDAGVPAPRTGYAYLTLNGADYGLYSIVEVADDDLLARLFDDPNGNLYENLANYCDLDDGVGCFDPEETDEGNNDALAALIQAAMASQDTWDQAMADQLNWEHYYGFLAMEMGICNWDSYSYDLSNYRLYHDPSTDRWSFIVSSADLSFGYRPWSYPNCGEYAQDLSMYNMGILSKRCLGSATCSAAVNERLLVIADQLESMDTSARIAAVRERIRGEVYSDPRSETSTAQFEEHVDCVSAWLEQRPGELRRLVGGR